MCSLKCFDRADWETITEGSGKVAKDTFITVSFLHRWVLSNNISLFHVFYARDNSLDLTLKRNSVSPFAIRCIFSPPPSPCLTMTSNRSLAPCPRFFLHPCPSSCPYPRFETKSGVWPSRFGVSLPPPAPHPPSTLTQSLVFGPRCSAYFRRLQYETMRPPFAHGSSFGALTSLSRPWRLLVRLFRHGYREFLFHLVLSI